MTTDVLAGDAPTRTVGRVSVGARSLASELIATWPDSVPFNAHRVLADHPELRADRSALLDIAYEEFCRRSQAGEPVSAEGFARGFPSVERSLRYLLQVHEYLDEHSPVLSKVIGWPKLGDVFLGFELLEEIGRGAFSRVFIATEQDVGRRNVVVKICQRGGDEAQILGRLQHSGVVPIHSVKRDAQSGLWAICMPYLGRATLFSVLDAVFSGGGAPPSSSRVLLEAAARANAETIAESIGRAPRLLHRGSFVDGVLLIGVQLAEALAFAHRQGICHGDIKPSNVLLTSAGRAMLLDFNLAFAYGQAELGAIGGTLPYMAPEQLQAVLGGGGTSGPPPDARMDLFALGVILYELLTGRLPFGPVSPGNTTSQLAAELLERRRRGAESLQQQNSHVERRLARIIESCLSFAPADRPHSAEELGRMLRLALSARRRLWRWMRGHQTGSVAVGGAGLFLSAGLLAGTIEQSPPGPTHGLSVDGSERSEDAPFRLVEGGLAKLQAGDPQHATALFDRALQLDPGLIEARFWRGRARLLLGDCQSACTDLEPVAVRVQSGSVTACLAYCYSLDHVHERAIQLYQQSLNEGCSSAAIWNNLGYSHYRRSELDQAERCLSEALRLEPDLPAAHHNMSQVLLRRATATRTVERLDLARRALQCIERAQQTGGDSGELFRDAANLCIYLSRAVASTAPIESDDFVRRALGFAEQAVDRGLAAQDLTAIWPLLPRTPEVEAARERLSRAPDADRRWQTVLVLDPLADDVGVTELRSELARASVR